MTNGEIKERIESQFRKVSKARDITAIYDGGDKYLVATTNHAEWNTEPYYLADKKNFEISFYGIPRMDKAGLAWYRNAKKNPVWKSEE